MSRPLFCSVAFPRLTPTQPPGQVFSYVGKWSVEEPSVYPGIPGDEGLVLKSKAAHHAISAQLDHPFDPKGKTLVLSYEVKLQQGLDCGGAYIKLLSDSDEVRSPLSPSSPPDRASLPARTRACASRARCSTLHREMNPS